MTTSRFVVPRCRRAFALLGPLVLAGHLGGRLQGGVHIKAPDGTPMANAMLTMLHGLGRTDIESFGDSSGELDLNTPQVVLTDAKE